MESIGPKEWKQGPKRVALFGMSGLGKTHLSSLLRASGGWFHYSVDYRIGTRYMGEHIADLFKKEAMQVPVLRELLLSDSIYISSNITFHNLAPLSAYLGKPGNEERNGLDFQEYLKRQDQHKEAEISATLDTLPFIERAHSLYGYENFICDTSGSICEVVNPWDEQDSVLKQLSGKVLLIWIKGSAEHTESLIRRFDKEPKPMYYQRDFIIHAWDEYLEKEGISAGAVDPDHFIRWTYARALAHRQPRYEKMAEWGISVSADEISTITTASEFNALVMRALERKAAKA